MATTDHETDESHEPDAGARPGHRWLWFVGLYVVSVAGLAGVVYGLKAMLDWIVFA